MRQLESALSTVRGQGGQLRLTIGEQLVLCTCTGWPRTRTIGHMSQIRAAIVLRAENDD